VHTALPRRARAKHGPLTAALIGLSCRAGRRRVGTGVLDGPAKGQGLQQKP
jgi:hypothetical protein